MSDAVGCPCCQICGGKSGGAFICKSCESEGRKPQYERKTTVIERASDYAQGVQYIGGEVQLAMRAAVITAYVKGYRDREGEEKR